MRSADLDVIGLQVEVVEPEGGMVVSEEGLQPGDYFSGKPQVFEDGNEVPMVDKARGVEEKHDADQAIHVRRVDVMEEGEASVDSPLN